ncbi:hypothetical protein D3C79_492230 [compost metagenome]
MSVVGVGVERLVVLAQGQADVFTFMGEVHVVERVERVLQLIEAFVEADLGQVLVANPHIRLAPGLAHAQAHFAIGADLPADI